jgi:hypothetical protein
MGERREILESCIDVPPNLVGEFLAGNCLVFSARDPETVKPWKELPGNELTTIVA